MRSKKSRGQTANGGDSRLARSMASRTTRSSAIAVGLSNVRNLASNSWAIGVIIQIYNTLAPVTSYDSYDACLDALADDCAVVIWGEFGRTPKISPIVGRDHWPQVNCALMAGGGLRHGQIIGATDRNGGEAVARPVTFGDVYATLFRHLGIDGGLTTLNDLNGRPRYLVEDHAKPLAELVS